MALAKIALLFLLIVSIFGTHVLMLSNGTIDRIRTAIETKTLPDSKIKLKTVWTGLPTDRFLNVMVCFFSVVDWKEHLPLFLQSIHFLGQLGSIYTLCVVEGLREGNKGKAVAQIVLWGLGMEFIGMTIFTPLFCFVHLLSSPTAAFVTDRRRFQESIFVDPNKANSVPWAISFGHFIPALLMMLTKKNVIEPVWNSQQLWILARLFHPVFTAINLSTLMSFTGRKEKSSGQRYEISMDALRNVYSYSTLLAVTSNIAALSLILSQAMNSKLAGKVNTVTLSKVFWPVYFWERPVSQISSTADGVHAFLQWDEIGSCLSMLVWALTVTIPTLYGEQGTFYVGRTLFTSTLMLLIGGPAAAAIHLIKTRDELFLGMYKAIEKS